MFNNRKVKKDRCHNFTLMIIPGKLGKTKTVSISRLLISSFLCIVLCIFIGIGAVVAKYGIVKNYNIKLKESNENYLANIKSLENLNKEKEEKINELSKSSEVIRQKLEDLNELEEKMKSILKSKNISMNISRSSTNITKTNSGNIIIDAEEKITEVTALINDVNKYIAAERRIPSRLPCTGRITSYFGYRGNPFGGSSSEFHSGLDIANSKGTSILASADGRVEFSGWKNGYGNVVIINHGNGYKSFYGHNSSLCVAVGQNVKRGQLIAKMGSTGRSTGNHCHFEVRLNNKAVNPLSIK